MSIEVFGTVAGVLGVASYLPQLVKVVQTKQTRDLSLGMWTITVLALIFWVIYGVLKDSVPVALANGTLLGIALVILFYKLRYH
jgi:MtN3 and saliva related transmembrane protein